MGILPFLRVFFIFFAHKYILIIYSIKKKCKTKIVNFMQHPQLLLNWGITMFYMGIPP